MSFPEVAHTSGRPRLKRLFWPAVLLVLITGGTVAAVKLAPVGGKVSPVADMPLAPVKRGPLTISVLQSGTIRSSQAATLKCEVEGRTTVLWVIDEGTRVKSGDLLVELDSSALVDRRIDQDIRVQNGRAALTQSQSSLEITKRQAEADISAAELALEFAQKDLEKYVEGESLQEIRKAESAVTIAEAELRRAVDKYEWSEKLAKELYITTTELQADELAKRKAEIELAAAQESLLLLKKYTQPRKLAEFKRDVEQKDFLLAKTKHRAAAIITDAQADLAAKELLFKREEERLAKIDDQIIKCKIKAPVDGMVVYATTGRYVRSGEEPLAQGIEVREQQELIRLPTAKEMMADVKVHESLLEKVRVGLPVRLTTEALPGRNFTGRVAKIAVLPDAQSSYLNPDLKVYNTEIAIDGDSEDLRPGMSCSAEIIADQLQDALYVPIQAVMRVGGRPTVYVMPAGGEKPEQKQISVGMDNNRMIHVVEGLVEGEQVLLAPPLPPSSVRETRLVPKPPGGTGGTPSKPDKHTPSSSSSKDKKPKVDTSEPTTKNKTPKPTKNKD